MIVVGIEEDKVTGKVRVHESEGEGCGHGGKESSPHHLVREVVGHLHIVTMHEREGSAFITNSKPMETIPHLSHLEYHNN